MNNKFYNIYMDIDTIFDFRFRVLESLGVEDIETKGWLRRASDNIFGINATFINNIIQNERDAMFSSSNINDIEELLIKVFSDAYITGLENEEDITINLYIDMKTIRLEEASLKIFKNAIEILAPQGMNVDIVYDLKINEYDSLIIYNSKALLEYIMIMDLDYTAKKLYTPFLLDRITTNVNVKVLIEQLIEIYSAYIDIDYPDIKHFSKKIKTREED